MRRLSLSLLALALALAACRAETVPTKPKASPAVRTKATSKPSAKPTGTATAPPVAFPVAPGPYVRLTGAVRLDGRSLVERGLAAATPGGVALTGQGTLLSDVGGGIRFDQAPALLSDQGSGLLSDQGSGLLSDPGSGLVANNSAGVIGQNGASVVGQNGASYAVLDGAPRFAVAQAAASELAAVEGAVVLPIDMRTGMPLGVVTRSDPLGGFGIQVPEALVGNVLIAVRLPAASRTEPAFTDPRLRPNLIASVAGSGPVRELDEDTAIVTAYLQACFVTRLEAVLSAEQGDAVVEKLAGAQKVVPALKAVLEGLIGELRAAAAASGADRLPAPQRARLARELAHGLLAAVDLDAVTIDSTLAPNYEGPAEPARAAMVTVMRQVREATNAKLAADPQAFAGKPYLAGTGLAIARGTDMTDFLVKTYLIPDVPDGLIKTGQVMGDLGVNNVGGADQRIRLTAAMYSLVGALGRTMIVDEAVKNEALARVRESGPRSQAK